jgi:hypothetical protein
MKLIVFIALILLLGPISMNACIDDGLCRGARLCSKEFFSSAVLSSHYVYIYICVYSHYFFYQANHALEEEERKKIESEDIERSIGRTTMLP